jgi:hypothetical protein
MKRSCRCKKKSCRECERRRINAYRRTRKGRSAYKKAYELNGDVFRERALQYLHSPKGRNRRLLRKYGITLEEYLIELRKRKGRCDGCGRRVRPLIKRGRKCQALNLDHCHESGRVRGFLCNDCNSALGYCRDNPAVLLGLVEYLKRATKAFKISMQIK